MIKGKTRKSNNPSQKIQRVSSFLGMILFFGLLLIGLVGCGILFWTLQGLNIENDFLMNLGILILLGIWLGGAYFVARAFNAFGKFGGQVVKKIAEPERTVSNFNPYNAGLPINDPKMFFGRQHILDEILKRLYNNSIVITGPRRIGKTSLLHQLKQRLADVDNPNCYFIPVLVDIQGTLEPDFFHVIMHNILTVLPEYLSLKVAPPLDFVPEKSLEYSNISFSKDLGKIVKALQQNYPDKKIILILLMDEMDVMNDYDQRVQALLRKIFITFADNLRAVVAGVNLHQQWKRHESPFYNMFNTLTLKPLSSNEARQLITQPVKGVYRYEPEAIEYILTVTEGQPFRIQQLCLEAVEHVAREKRPFITLADIESVLSSIEWIEDSVQDSLTVSPTELKPKLILSEKREGYHLSSSSNNIND